MQISVIPKYNYHHAMARSDMNKYLTKLLLRFNFLLIVNSKKTISIIILVICVISFLFYGILNSTVLGTKDRGKMQTSSTYVGQQLMDGRMDVRIDRYTDR